MAAEAATVRTSARRKTAGPVTVVHPATVHSPAMTTFVVVPGASVRVFGEDGLREYDAWEIRPNLKLLVCEEAREIHAWLRTLQKNDKSAYAELAGLARRREQAAVWSEDGDDLDAVIADWIEERGGKRAEWTEAAAGSRCPFFAVTSFYGGGDSNCRAVGFDHTFRVGGRSATRASGYGSRLDDEIRATGVITAVAAKTVSVEGRHGTRRLTLGEFFALNRSRILESEVPLPSAAVVGTVLAIKDRRIVEIEDGRFAFVWGDGGADGGADGVLPASLRDRNLDARPTHRVDCHGIARLVRLDAESTACGWRLHGILTDAVSDMLRDPDVAQTLTQTAVSDVVRAECGYRSKRPTAS